jgi:hypothetical protein
MMWKQKLIALAVPATLALAAGGLVAAYAATPTPPKPPAAAAENETGEKAEGPETPGGPEIGHADDPTKPDIDHQFNGEE